jgi:hypothetical protein
MRGRGMTLTNAIIESVSHTDCRLRAVVLFSPGTQLEFDFGLPADTIRLRGRVHSRSGNGPRFFYTLLLDELTPQQTARVDAALAGWKAQRGVAPMLDCESVPNELVRANARVASQFGIEFRAGDDDFAPAHAGDISSGGLSMTCTVAMTVGTLLDLRLALPGDPSGEVLRLRARVVWNRVVSPAAIYYGLAFCQASSNAIEQIRSYVQQSRMPSDDTV